MGEENEVTSLTIYFDCDSYAYNSEKFAITTGMKEDLKHNIFLILSEDTLIPLSWTRKIDDERQS